MRSFQHRFPILWQMVLAAVVLGSAIMVCFANLEATVSAPNDGQYACLVTPANPSCAVLLAHAGDRQGGSGTPGLPLFLSRRLGLLPDRATWQSRQHVSSSAPSHEQYRSGPARRAPPHTLLSKPV